MGLFRQLRRLYRPEKFQFEDFHTEIVAQVLENSPALTLEWSRSIKATTSSDANHIEVRTQETFRRSLIIRQPVDLTSPFTFRRTRWCQFYEHLKAHVNGDGLATELKLFMEENRMSLGHQFRSTDLVALEDFFSAKALMDETLEGEVSEVVRRLPGGLFAARRGLTYFRDEHRYVASNGDWGDIECHVGYWLPHEKPDEGVWVGVTLYTTPAAPARDEVIAAFRAWLGREGSAWQGEQLDDPRAKSSIYKGTVLQSLMSNPDHVDAIKNYFLSLLGAVDLFRQNNRNLRWCGGESDIKMATESDDGESHEPNNSR